MSSSSECALCHNKAKLCKSHIIPEFAYKSMYDTEHRVNLLFANPKDHIPLRRPRKGIYEKLLCLKCETQISNYETEAKRLWDGNGVVINRYKEGGDLFVIRNLDYTKFKLFQLSILWRASVSQLEFFSKVNLGPHEEVIRKMLLKEDPGKVADYGCVLIRVTHNGIFANDIIPQPVTTRICDDYRKHKAYDFMFGGVKWIFVVSKKPAGHLPKCFTQIDGSCFMLVKPLHEATKLIEIFGKTVERVMTYKKSKGI